MARPLRLLLLLLTLGALYALAPSTASAAEPPNQNDPCSKGGRNTCKTAGIGRYARYRYGLRWFGDYRRAVPGIKGATWCIDLRYWYPGKQFGYEEGSTEGLRNREGERVSAATLARMNYAAHRFGRTRDKNRQAAVMLYVHGQMRDGAPGEASPNAIGRAVAARYRTIQRAAARYAGGYKVALSTDRNLTAGKEATLTVKVTTAAGRGVPATKVALEAAGASLPKTVTTNSSGTATARFTPTNADTDLTVSAKTLGTAAATPRLYSPSRGKAVQNGQRLIAAKPESYSGELKQDITSVQPKVVTAATPGVIAAGQASQDKVTITGTGADWKAPVEVRLFGPYRTREAITCQGEPAAKTNYEAKTGETMTPGITLTRPGIYAYQLVVGATASTEAVTTPCPDPAEIVTVQAQPRVTTQVSKPAIQPSEMISDSVFVSGLAGEPATVDVALYGPFPAQDRMSCDGAPVWSGALEVPGDGTYQTAEVKLDAPGYYVYRERLRGSEFVQPFEGKCGEASETTIVRGAPNIRTQVSAGELAIGGQLTDQAFVSGLGRLAAPVKVELWGPYESRERMSCQGTPYASQTFTAEGDGEYRTEPVTIDRAGFYTYRMTVDGTPAYAGLQTPCGEPSETAYIKAAPKIETQVSEAIVRPGSKISDQIRVSGLGKTPATIKVQLYGPYATKAEMDCSGSPYREGTVRVNGDGVVNSEQMTVKRAGFYTFVEKIEAAPGIPEYRTECGLESQTSLGQPLILTGPGDIAEVRNVTASGKGDKRVPPTRVRFGRLRIDAPVSPVGIDLEAGALGVSKDINRVGWWRDGSAPDSKKGTTLLSGHVDSAKRGAGAFFPLKRARRGDRVTVTLRGGKTRRYRVTSMRRRHKNRLPSNVFDATGPKRLVLVTCGGPFQRSSGTYRDNIIVTAVPA